MVGSEDVTQNCENCPLREPPDGGSCASFLVREPPDGGNCPSFTKGNCPSFTKGNWNWNWNLKSWKIPVKTKSWNFRGFLGWKFEKLEKLEKLFEKLKNFLNFSKTFHPPRNFFKISKFPGSKKIVAEKCNKKLWDVNFFFKMFEKKFLIPPLCAAGEKNFGPFFTPSLRRRRRKKFWGSVVTLYPRSKVYPRKCTPEEGAPSVSPEIWGVKTGIP